MKRADLNHLLKSIKENLFLKDEGKRANLLNLLVDSKFEEINETTGTIVISTPSQFSSQILNGSIFKAEFTDVADNILNSNYEVAFVWKEDWDKRNIDETTQELQLMTLKSDTLKPEFTIENFLVSEKNGQNKMVKQAALSVGLKPGAWTPVFICGGSGLGKTHILHAIGNKIQETFSNLKIRYLESKDFNDLVYDGAITTDKVRGILEEFLSYDVLLVDDIQMLQSKEKGREVFFSILTDFINNNKQIVITSDQYPEELKGFEERFITRFKGGVNLSVTPPDSKTAKSIFLQKLCRREESAQMEFTDDALDFIATSFGANIRELEGALNRIIFWSVTSNRISDDKYTIEDMLDIFDGMATTRRGISTQHIVSTVSSHYQVTSADVLGVSRKAEIVLPRQISIYFCKKILGLSLMEIGRYFNRDHSTIMSSIKKIEKISQSDGEMSKTIYNLHNKIKTFK